MTLEDRYAKRLLEKISVGDGCWSWTAAKSAEGYGAVAIPVQLRKGGAHAEPAHRAVFRLLVGEFPSELQIDHVCHNEDAGCAGGPTCPHRLCVRPDHLRATTNLANRMGSHRFPSRRTHCPRNHLYDEANTLRGKKGNRYCKACWMEKQRARQSRPEVKRLAALKARQKYWATRMDARPADASEKLLAIAFEMKSVYNT